MCGRRPRSSMHFGGGIMADAFTLTVKPNGVADLVFDLPGEKINKFSPAVLEELDRILDQLAQRKDIKLLCFKSAKKDIFIAGADLHTFVPAFKDPALVEKIITTGHRVTSKMSRLPFPTLAIIDGATLGGGLEFALSCTYRLVTDNPKTLLGVPEVTLGIFPGWGGSQRLPRLIGLENGLNMILTGKGVNGYKAWKMGLADHIVASQFLDSQAQDFIESLMTSKAQAKIESRREHKSLKRILLESNPLGRWIIYKKAREQVLEKTKGQYPAPLIVLKLIEDTYTLPLAEGLKKEAEVFVQNVPNMQQAKYLIPLFFTQEALKKDFGTKEPPKPIHSAAIIGAGTMGATLAWLFTNSQIFTRLKDISWDLVAKGYGVVKNLYSKGVKVKKVTPVEADRKFNLLSGTIDYSGFQHADIVLEAATENLDLKKKIFQETEKAVPKEAVIASNTSSLTIAEMGADMTHPERFVGMHFFNPPNKMPLVEIVAGPKTSAATVATAVDLSKKFGKVPIVVQDCPGFLVNRIFVLGANEVLYFLQERIPQETIAKKLMDFGMPMDPFLLSDEVGNDVAYKVTKSFEKAYGDRMKAPKILELMYEGGLYGKKAGKGFYLYKGDSEQLNPKVNELLASFDKKNTDPEEIIPRFTAAMINEAARCLEENIVSKPSYLDMALIMGIGFPPFRGGLLRYADDQGIDKIVKQLQDYEQKYGSRFRPAGLLLKMKEEGKAFYQLESAQI